MPEPLLLLPAGAMLVVTGLVAARASGAEARMGRRLAGARQIRVGDLLAPGELPGRPVRVIGRIRCPNPIVTERDDHLVAFHRDVQVKPPGGGGWRSIERIRETRGFELWDHDGSLPLDPAAAAEPLVVLPHVWRGTTAELTHPGHLAAVARLGGSSETAWPARSITRIVSVVERLLVLAAVERRAEGPELVPPEGGYVISGLELEDAMRLLAGNRRWLLLAGYGLVVVGAAVALVGVIGSVIG
jgi:hypothetical protein